MDSMMNIVPAKFGKPSFTINENFKLLPFDNLDFVIIKNNITGKAK